MFSSLASIADRNFIIGFFLPALLGLLALLALFADWAPVQELWLAARNLESFAGLTVTVVVLWSSALLLQLANLPLYRLLEGYTYPVNARWSGLKLHQLRAWRTAHHEFDRLAELARTSQSPSALAAYGEAHRRFLVCFPANWRHVLPTAFGNSLRAFETYPDAIYNVAAIAAWPRLCAVIPETFAALLNTARAEVDFFVNLAVLSFAFAAIALLRGVALLIALAVGVPLDGMVPLVDLSAGVIAAALAWVSYHGAIGRARSWGALVRSAFDLYLPALARQLGYELPDTEQKRRDFWDAMSRQWLDHDIADPSAFIRRPVLPDPDRA